MYYVFQDFEGVTHEVTLHEERYSVNNRLNLTMLEKGNHFLTLTINVPEVTLKPNDIIIQNYKENLGVLQFLIEEDIVAPPLYSVLVNGLVYPVVSYKGFIMVDPEDVEKGQKVQLRSDYVTELVFWNPQLHTGVVERSDGTPVSIDIRDIVKIISR